ncbi:MAG: hypothetical protein JSW04_04265 [Desulfobacterales bacterium]|nr:MAG: hypothetical protein JSW04_04265 [Desulfobacterales bacterium]
MDYTCADFRVEMILLSLRRQLHLDHLNEQEKNDILLKIKQLEKEMGLE